MTVTEIKAEIFDIVTAQEQLRTQFEQLDKMKQGKLQELQQALQDTVVTTNVQLLLEMILCRVSHAADSGIFYAYFWGWRIVHSYRN